MNSKAINNDELNQINIEFIESKLDSKKKRFYFCMTL